MDWKPRLVDIAWLGSVIQLIDDGGIIIYPATMLILKVDKKHRKLTLMNPDVLGIDHYSMEVYRRARIIATHLEYEVVAVGGGG